MLTSSSRARARFVFPAEPGFLRAALRQLLRGASKERIEDVLVLRLISIVDARGLIMAIDFWFSIGSTYTFLAAMRLQDVAGRTGIAFRWRPFNVRAIMIEMDNIPFAKKPIKAAYMWRDIERRAEMFDLAVKFPVPYPLQQLELANRVALVAAEEGWCEPFSVASYRRWFGDSKPAGSEPNLSESIVECGQDPARVLALADSPSGIAALEQATQEAKTLGIFGSPSFVVGKELFWGHDRLDDAIEWHRRHPQDAA